MRVLFIQFKRLGDVLMVTPSVRALKAAFPDCELHFLVERGSAPAIRHHPQVDKVLVREEQTLFDRVRGAGRASYDIAVDFMGTPRSARVAWLTRARKRIGFRKRGRSLFYTHAVDPGTLARYSAHEKLKLLEPLGVRGAAGLPEIYEGEEERAAAVRTAENLRLREGDRVVAFSPVSRRPYKRWPEVKYARVCDILFEKHGFRYLPLFGPGEEPFVEKVIAASAHPDAFLYPYPPPPFGALKGLISRCLFYFGNDNAIRHVAVAGHKPTAAVFGTPDPRHWTPPGDARHLTLWGRDSIDAVSVEEMTGLVEKLLGALNAA